MSMRSRFLSVFLLSAMVMAAASASARVNPPVAPEPSLDEATLRAMEAQASSVSPFITGKTPPPPALAPALIGPAIECFNFDDNITHNNGFVNIPPDPHNAVGLAHVVNVGNVYLEWRPKNGTVDVPQFRAGLQAFFAGTPGALGVSPFDPKVIYDQYADRFVVICLERVTSPALDSRILVAVSKTSDPNAGWWKHAINSLTNIGGVNRWADYPGLGVDDDALYICNNMFSAAGAFGGVRLWVLNRTPTYNGPDGNIAQTIYDPYTLSGQPGFATTTQIAHMYGPEPANVGTFLVSYSGLSDGLNEYVDIIRVDNPLGAISFNFQQLFVGNFDNTAAAFPDAPQLGSTRLIETNDRRALDCVWRNNNLYMCMTSVGVAVPNTGQATAHWVRVNTTNLGALAVADHGDVGADDLGAGTFTFFPSIMVDCDGNMAVGFSASNAGIYCGAYYATRNAFDAPGTIGPTCTLALGTDWYVRTFSNLISARNRWGDYSGLSICPLDQSTFWVYNEYACTRGTPTTVGGVTEEGRWCTKLGKFFLKQPVTVAITSFSARYNAGLVELRSTFRSDLGVEAVNVYRAGSDGTMKRIETVWDADGRGFEYLDSQVESGKTYHYQIGVADADGEFLSPVQDVTIPSMTASLGQNTPNPFNPTTQISYFLPSRDQVSVVVYDASGRLVRTLVDEVRGNGAHAVTWDGRDNAGRPAGSGIYFYRLTAGKHSESKKMVLLK
jgi:hypothetical protein